MPEVIGIYDYAPPEGISGAVSSIRVANIGAVPLLLRATRVRDRLRDALADLLG